VFALKGSYIYLAAVSLESVDIIFFTASKNCRRIFFIQLEAGINSSKHSYFPFRVIVGITMVVHI